LIGLEGNGKAVLAALEELPRVPLAALPTPLQEARRLREALGGEGRCPRILIKRDDMTDIALGGNKARKLEYLVADALARGATALVTTGGPQSNHARMTAAAARMAGLRASLVLSVDGVETPPTQGNLLLDRILGAEVHLLTTGGMSEEAKISEVVSQLEAHGERPYVVVVGGSCRVGALGYVRATHELLSQLEEMREAPARLYYASGSRGTQAGVELGARVFGAPWVNVGIAVSPGEDEKRQRAVRIMRESAGLLDVDIEVHAHELRTEQQYIGAGYAIPTAGCIEAIRLVARTEGIILDPVYTGKGMAGMIDHIRSGQIDPAETILFLHTGGAPGLFAQAEGVLRLLENV
jgi:D-cysteine desulfhydrase family pyridoxal phosphate-dependent enzyme